MSYCIGVNRTGNDGNKAEYNGHSAVYDGLGQNLTELNREEAFVKEVSLDKQQLMETRRHFKFLQDRDTFILK